MFCDCLPCECFATVKKKAAPRKKAVARTIETVDLLDAVPEHSKFAAMKAMASTNPQGDIEAYNRTARYNLPMPEVEEDKPEDLEMDEAIKVLLDTELLHPDEVERFKHLAPDELAAWKRQYEETLAARSNS